MSCTGCLKVLATGAIGVSKATLRIDRADDETVKARRDICRACEHAEMRRGKLRLLSQCDACGCFISAKTSLASERCPDARW